MREIQVSPNGKYIAIGYGWKRIKIISYDRRYDIADFDGSCFNPFDRVKIDLAFSPDSKFLAYNEIQKETSVNIVQVFNVEERKISKSIMCPAKWITVQFSADGQFLAVGSIKNMIFVYNLEKSA